MRDGGVDHYTVDHAQGAVFVLPVTLRDKNVLLSCGKSVAQQISIMKHPDSICRTIHFACPLSEDEDTSARVGCANVAIWCPSQGTMSPRTWGCVGQEAHTSSRLAFLESSTRVNSVDTNRKNTVLLPSVLTTVTGLTCIPARAVSDLSASGSPCNLIANCAADDPEKLKNTPKQQGINRPRFVVRRHCAKKAACRGGPPDRALFAVGIWIVHGLVAHVYQDEGGGGGGGGRGEGGERGVSA